MSSLRCLLCRVSSRLWHRSAGWRSSLPRLLPQLCPPSRGGGRGRRGGGKKKLPRCSCWSSSTAGPCAHRTVCLRDTTDPGCKAWLIEGKRFFVCLRRWALPVHSFMCTCSSSCFTVSASRGQWFQGCCHRQRVDPHVLATEADRPLASPMARVCPLFTSPRPAPGICSQVFGVFLASGVQEIWFTSLNVFQTRCKCLVRQWILACVTLRRLFGRISLIFLREGGLLIASFGFLNMFPQLDSGFTLTRQSPDLQLTQFSTCWWSPLIGYGTI